MGLAASAVALLGLQGPLFLPSVQDPRLVPHHPPPPSQGPHLADVGTGWHWVVHAIDGEDDVRQGADGATVDDVLSEKGK